MKEIKSNKIGLVKKGFPKFESVFWLSIGVVAGIVLVADAVWGIVAHIDDAFIPLHLFRVLRIIGGMVLSVHSIDIIRYRKNHRIVVIKDSEAHKIIMVDK